MSRRPTQDDTARVPRARSGTPGRRRERTGTEPVTARSALKLRLVLSLAGLLVFVLGTVLALFAAADLVVVLLRLARAHARGAPR